MRYQRLESADLRGRVRIKLLARDSVASTLLSLSLNPTTRQTWRLDTADALRQTTKVRREGFKRSPSCECLSILRRWLQMDGLVDGWMANVVSP